MRALDRTIGRPDVAARLLWAVRGLVLGMVLLHLAAAYLPEAAAWGVWPVTYVSPALRAAAAFVVILLCVPAVGCRLSDWIVGQLGRLPALAGLHRQALFTLAALLAVAVFWTFRLIHTRWGDTYLLIHALALPDPTQRLVYSWQAPLTVYWHARLWAFGQRVWGWVDGMPAYAVTSVAAGGLFVFVVLNLAWELVPGRVSRLLVAGLLLSLGTVQLFFGYVENYSLAALAVTVYLWLAVRYLHQKTPLWAAALVLAFANGLHPSTIYLAPSLLVLGGIEARRRSLWTAAASIAWPMLVVAGGVLLLMTAGGHGVAALLGSDRPGGGDGRWFVPLRMISTRWEHYTMFSVGHLVDWVNEQLLTAPVSLGVIVLVLLFVGLRSWRTATDGDPATRRVIGFLAVAAACALFFITVWNADYGGQRDWDLFSLASLPLTVLAGLLLARALPDERSRVEAALLLVGVSALHTAAWVYQNTLPWSWPS